MIRLLIDPDTPTVRVKILPPDHWYDSPLATAALAGLLSLGVALLVLYLQRRTDDGRRREQRRLDEEQRLEQRRLDDSRNRARSASEAAEALTAAVFAVSNELSLALRDPGFTWQRSQARHQAQRPFDEVALRKAPDIYDQAVLDEINQTAAVLNEFLRWADEEDDAFATVLERVAGPDAPEDLSQNPVPAAGLVRVLRQFERLNLILNAFRRGEQPEPLDPLPPLPDHTERWT